MPLGCCKMHFNHLIKAIVFSSVPLGMLINMCDFRKIPKMFRSPYRYISEGPIIGYIAVGVGLKIFGIPRKSHMFISSPKGTDGKNYGFDQMI